MPHANDKKYMLLLSILDEVRRTHVFNLYRIKPYLSLRWGFLFWLITYFDNEYFFFPLFRLLLSYYTSEKGKLMLVLVAMIRALLHRRALFLFLKTDKTTS